MIEHIQYRIYLTTSKICVHKEIPILIRCISVKLLLAASLTPPALLELVNKRLYEQFYEPRDISVLHAPLRHNEFVDELCIRKLKIDASGLRDICTYSRYFIL